MAEKNHASLFFILLMASISLLIFTGGAWAAQVCSLPSDGCPSGESCCYFTNTCGPSDIPCSECNVQSFVIPGQCCGAGSTGSACDNAMFYCSDVSSAKCCGVVPGCKATCQLSGGCNSGAMAMCTSESGSTLHVGGCNDLNQAACGLVPKCVWRPDSACQAPGETCGVPSTCCSGSTCGTDGLCKDCNGGQACSSASECCSGYSCELQGAGKTCCIGDGSSIKCNVDSQCCGGICTNHVCQAAICDFTPTAASYVDITLNNNAVSVFVYNLSKKDYIKKGMRGALVFAVNLTNKSNPSVCYGVTDSTGQTSYPYDPLAGGCTDNWFIFCPLKEALQSGDDGIKARGICLNSTGLDYNTVIAPAPSLCPGATSFVLRDYSNYFASHNELYVCNKVPSDYAPLCWPLMLIMGLLLGASFAVGKNPFQAFDFSSPRMNRGRQYSMRVQQRSFDATSIIMGAINTATSVKSGVKQISSGGKGSGGVESSAKGGFGKYLKSEFKPHTSFKDIGANVEGLKTKATERKAMRTLDKAKADFQSKYTPAELEAMRKPAVGTTPLGSAMLTVLSTLSSPNRKTQSKMKKDLIREKKQALTNAKADEKTAKALEKAKTDFQAKYTPEELEKIRGAAAVSSSPASLVTMALSAPSVLASKKAFEDNKKLRIREKTAALADAKKNGDADGIKKARADLDQAKNMTFGTPSTARARAELYQAKNWKFGSAAPASLGDNWTKKGAWDDLVGRNASSSTGGTNQTGQNAENTAKPPIPSMGVSGAGLQIAMSTPDSWHVIGSFFKKSFWSKDGFKDRRDAVGVTQVFDKMAGATSTGQALGMWLLFLLKKSMENSKLRDQAVTVKDQNDYRIKTNLRFSGVRETATSLFRLYSVMSILSSYTRGLGAATGSRALSENGIGFLEKFNNRTVASIGKYDFTAASFASLVDPSLSGYYVGGGLPYPLSFLTPAVTGAMAWSKKQAYSLEKDLPNKSLVKIDDNGLAYWNDGSKDRCVDTRTNKELAKFTKPSDDEVAKMKSGFIVVDQKAKPSSPATFSLLSDREEKRQFEKLKSYNQAQAEWESFVSRFTFTKMFSPISPNERSKYLRDLEFLSNYANITDPSANATKHAIRRYNRLTRLHLSSTDIQAIKNENTDQINAMENGSKIDLKLNGRDCVVEKTAQGELEIYGVRNKDSLEKYREKYERAQILARNYEALAMNYSILSNLPNNAENREIRNQILSMQGVITSNINTIDFMEGILKSKDICTDARALVKEYEKSAIAAQLEKNKQFVEDSEETVERAHQGKLPSGQKVNIKKAEEIEKEDMLDKVKKDIKTAEVALEIYDAVKTGLINPDNLKSADESLVKNLMVASNFADSYTQLHVAAIQMGLESSMPKPSEFIGKSTDELAKDRGVLNVMCENISNYGKVRFKNDDSAGAYYDSLKEMMVSGNDVLTTGHNLSIAENEVSKAVTMVNSPVETELLPWLEQQRDEAIKQRDNSAEQQKMATLKLATALENHCDMLLENLKFDGRFAGTKEKITNSLKDAKLLKSTNPEGYLNYVSTMSTVIVQTHQTSDSYLNAQMEKTGWRDRSPYRSIPMASSLNSLRVAGVEGARPFDSNLTFPAGRSLSNSLYASGAEIKVPKYNPGMEGGLENPMTTMEKPIHAKEWVSDINQRLQQNKISIEDAAPVQVAYEAYKKDKTADNFEIMSKRTHAATKAIPELVEAVNSGKLDAEDTNAANAVIAQYRNVPSPGNSDQLLRAHIIIMKKINKKD